MNQQDNRVPLWPDTTLRIYKRGTREISEFIITEIVGCGSSCIVYSAIDRRAENNRVRIKEYYPGGIPITRNRNNSLVISDEKQFASGMDRFINSCQLQIRLRNTDALTNTTSSIQGIYEGNNTIYTVLTYNTGSSYDKIKDDSLNFIFRIARSTALSLRGYHAQGYLHLDIKPANVFVMPESPDMVLLFDFDSIVSEEELHSGKCKMLLHSKNWAAPELIKGDRLNISKKTDHYSIGAMIFERIYHRPADWSEQISTARFEFGSDNPLFTDIDPKVFHELEKLFRYTLHSSPSRRYETDDELIAQLDLLIKLSAPDRQYIIPFIPECKGQFAGREQELESISAAFEKGHILFLCGEGGIGKSELARRYSALKRKKYLTTVFITYENDMVSSVNKDENVPINALYRNKDEAPAEFFRRKLALMQKLCDDKTLLIIDNFDTDRDDRLRDVLKLSCDILITTRADYSRSYPQLRIAPLSFEAISSMFESSGFRLDQENKTALSKLYGLYSGNTMVMKFLLENMEENYTDPISVLRQISSYQTNGALSREEMLRLYFRVIGFEKISKAQRAITEIIAEAPLSGIRMDVLKSICGAGTDDAIKALIHRGFVNYSNASRRCTMHPIIRDAMIFFRHESRNTGSDEALFTDAGNIFMQLSPEELKAHCARAYHSYKATGIFKEYYPSKIKIFGMEEFDVILRKMKKHFVRLSENEIPLFLYSDTLFITGRRGTVFTNMGIHTKCAGLFRKASYQFVPYDDIRKLFYEEGKDSGDKIHGIFILNRRYERLEINYFFPRTLSEFRFIKSFFETAVSCYPGLLERTLPQEIKRQSQDSGSGYSLGFLLRRYTLNAGQCEKLTETMQAMLSGRRGARRRYYTVRSKKFRKALSKFTLTDGEIPVLISKYGCMLTNIGIHNEKKWFIRYSDIACIQVERFFEMLIIVVYTNDGKYEGIIIAYRRLAMETLEIITFCLENMNRLLLE